MNPSAVVQSRSLVVILSKDFPRTIGLFSRKKDTSEAPPLRIAQLRPLTSSILNNWVRHWEVASLRQSPRILAATKKPPFPKAHQVVEIDEYDQHQNQRDADLESNFLDPLAERPSPDGFDRVEHEMAAVEHRNW